MIKTRQTKSGVRYEVRYRDPTGRERSKTFTTKKLAEKYEREQRTEVARGSWLDNRQGSQTFAEFMDKWLAERHDLRPRTLELYRSLLKRHLKPTFGALTMAKLSASSTAVRSWNAELAREHPVTAAKAYRLLRQLCSTAVADGIIGRNPCAVKGAGQEHSPERPTATVAEVTALAGAMPAGPPARHPARCVVPTPTWRTARARATRLRPAARQSHHRAQRQLCRWRPPGRPS